MVLSQEYLRQLAEVFIYYVLPADEGKSECLHFLIRELLTENVLGLAIDTFSDPDFIVNGIINASAFLFFFFSFFLFVELLNHIIISVSSIIGSIARP